MTLPAVIFDDAELWATGYLADALDARSEPYTDDVFVSNEIPKDASTGEPVRRDRMVIVRRDGGAQSQIVLDNPRLALDCWGQSKQEVADLARMVAALMVTAPGDSNVKACTVTSGPTRVPDPSGQPRAFVTVDIVTKGTDLT